MDMKTSPLAQLNDPSLLKTDALINGQWVKGPSRFAVTDPATGAHLADVANLGPAEAQAAIAAANAAWGPWKAKTAKERSIILRKWYDLLMANQDDLGRIMTAEQGKPLPEAKGEVAYGASFVEWFAEEAKRVNGETLPQFDNNRRLLVLKQPIGVCAAITPWNFPLAMITRKVAPALAAGCPVIIKPAELTPLTALAAAELAIRAGIPAGVLNMITADADNSIAVGQVLCASEVVRHISFTGSTEVGRILMAQSAPTVKKMSLELGGNAPFIVFEDADIDSAVEGAFASKYRNAGQTCVCSNRIYVQEAVYEGPILRTDGDRRCQRRHALCQGRDLRPFRAHLQVQNRARSGGCGQQHRVRPGQLLLQPRCGPHLPRRRSAGIRHGGHQRGHFGHRACPVWRRQTVRLRP